MPEPPLLWRCAPRAYVIPKSALTFAGGSRERGGHRSQLSAGVARPQETLRHLHQLQEELQVAKPAGPLWMCHALSWGKALL